MNGQVTNWYWKAVEHATSPSGNNYEGPQIGGFRRGFNVAAAIETLQAVNPPNVAFRVYHLERIGSKARRASPTSGT